MGKINIWKPVLDWKENIHLLENPHNLIYDVDSFDYRWKRLFSVPYVKQKSEEWLEIKKDFISGSECATALNNYQIFNPYEDYQDYVLWKAGRIKRVDIKFALRCMSHGNRHEPTCARR